MPTEWLLLPAKSVWPKLRGQAVRKPWSLGLAYFILFGMGSLPLEGNLGIICIYTNVCIYVGCRVSLNQGLLSIL